MQRFVEKLDLHYIESIKFILSGILSYLIREDVSLKKWRNSAHGKIVSLAYTTNFYQLVFCLIKNVLILLFVFAPPILKFKPVLL